MRRLLLTVAIAVATLTMVSATLAQSAWLEVPWHSIDGGSTTTSSGGDYTLSGTAGQPDAGVSSGGIYAVQGGFWGLPPASPSPPGDHQVRLPLVLK